MRMTPFDIHNLFRKSIAQFLVHDPHLSQLKKLPYVFESPLEEELPLATPGIYIVTGGRQVGKSTLIKQIIRNLLQKKNVAPECIWYLPCDTIETFDQLLFHIESFQEELGARRPFYLFIDEITYVREWDRAIKSLADAGFFQHGSVVITGSDALILKEAMMRFPGRRGTADQHDFHYYPLSFSQYVALKDASLAKTFMSARENFQNNLSTGAPAYPATSMRKLDEHFHAYLMCGGFLKAINDTALTKSILSATYRTYVQWIVGDMLKRGKQEKYLREIVEAIIPRLTKQISWHKITDAISIDHHQTVADYLQLLERMDVLHIVPALREDKLSAAPKKDKKIHFSDPFIFHALHAWVENDADPFKCAETSLAADIPIQTALAEGVVASLLCRRWEGYYIKAEGEVDIALVDGKKFFPIEIKYSHTIRPSELKQILKYPRGIVAYRGVECGSLEQLEVIPLPLMAFVAA